MGHEQYRIVNGKRIPWNDKNVVQEIISEIENAQRGVESLRLSGLLRPASAVNAPDPTTVPRV